MAVDPNRDDELRECDCIPAVLVRNGEEPQEMWVSDDTYGYCGCGTPPDKIYFVCWGGCVKYTPTAYSVDELEIEHE
jgi:hypothetical protein